MEHSVGAGITTEDLEELYDVIEKQRSQLSLALSALAELGFDMGDFMDAMV